MKRIPLPFFLLSETQGISLFSSSPQTSKPEVFLRVFPFKSSVLLFLSIWTVISFLFYPLFLCFWVSISCLVFKPCPASVKRLFLIQNQLPYRFPFLFPLSLSLEYFKWNTTARKCVHLKYEPLFRCREKKEKKIKSFPFSFILSFFFFLASSFVFVLL